MNYLVLDASAAAALCLAEPEAPAVARAMETASDDGFIVPVVWPIEVSNVLRSSIARGRIARTDAIAATEVLLAFPIFVNQTTLAYGLRETLRVALHFNLTSYDASYLDLALMRGLPLLSLDKRLRVAAQAAGVRVLPD